MTSDFLIGAVRASRDLHPQVKTELEEILIGREPVEPKKNRFPIPVTVSFDFECECGAPMMKDQPHCMACGRAAKWE